MSILESVAASKMNGHLKETSNPAFGFTSVQVFKNQLLGVGHYGTVYKAKCDGLLCAAKIFHPSCFQPPAGQPPVMVAEHHGSVSMKAFEREYQFLNAIRHPNIVLYLGFRHVPNIDLPVLIMEIMDESLTHFLESSNCPLPRGIQVNFCHDISLALSYLHLNDIVHGTLSSNNILLLSNIRAKLIDFGMAKLRSTQAPHNAVYMPPEFKVADSSQLSSSVDCFSFGVLVIQILTRKIPKPAKKYRQLQGKPNLNSLVPEIERRQNHIEEIDPKHPLLPMSLACLSDEARVRPSARDLVFQIEELKNSSSLSRSRCSSPDCITNRDDVHLGNCIDNHTIDVPDLKHVQQLVEHDRSVKISQPKESRLVDSQDRKQEHQPLKFVSENGVFQKGKQFVNERRKGQPVTP